MRPMEVVGMALRRLPNREVGRRRSAIPTKKARHLSWHFRRSEVRMPRRPLAGNLLGAKGLYPNCIVLHIVLP